MQNPTPLFPNFHLPTLRRKPRSAQQLMAEKMEQVRQKSFSQLGECFGKLIPNQHLRPSASGALSRRRKKRGKRGRYPFSEKGDATLFRGCSSSLDNVVLAFVDAKEGSHRVFKYPSPHYPKR